LSKSLIYTLPKQSINRHNSYYNPYKLPRWSTWSPRLAPIALYMAMKLYPEQFQDVNFEKVADRFYQKVFGISYYKVRQYEGY